MSRFSLLGLPLEASIAIITVIVFVLLDAAIFIAPLYRAYLAPESTAGSFERGIARVNATSQHPERDVLVLGDSRIFNGLDTARADAAAPHLHFVNGALAGTTPRVWTTFDRIVDPRADRYRAIVIPVDTYADDDSAIGSIDGNDRGYDLRYLALRADAAETLAIAASFSTPESRLEALFDLSFRGPLLREDIQAFARDPRARLAMIHDAAPYDTPTFRNEHLTMMQIDFTHDRIVAPPDMPASALAELRRQVFFRPSPSASYAAYRREWLGAIVARYAHASVPVFFVRIPTRPAHRAPPPEPSGTLLALAREHGVRLLPQAPYVALERLEDFADFDHVNAAGAAKLSDQLGRDVARALADPHFATTASRTSTGRSESDRHEVRASVPRSAVVFIINAAHALQIGVPLRFQSYEFAVFFAIIAGLVTLVRTARVRTIVLLAASWYVYARWNAAYVLVLLALSVTDYAFGLGIARTTGARRKLFLVTGIAFNLAFLGTMKYADFVTTSIANALHLGYDPWALHVLVPIGISFHTFQSISYLVDVSRGKARVVRDPLDYALYLAFFPQLLAGPIVRAQRFFGELWNWRRPNSRAIARGLVEIAIGLLKKSALADRFAPVADAYFGNVGAHPGSPAAWSAAIAFGLQIYFDFSGYSDIAIGCARVLGFDFPENFRRPYLAWSITEFWRRWHMTLSAWLRDYLYIPLGGNRGSRYATLRNLMITMLLGGLWHGASWTFVAWGGYHGILLAGERLLGVGRVRDAAPPGIASRIVRTIVTFVLVLVGWILFRAHSFGDAVTAASALVMGGPGASLLDLGQVSLAAIAIGIEIAIETRRNLPWVHAPFVRIGAAVALLFALELATFPGAAAPFVYFKF